MSYMNDRIATGFIDEDGEMKDSKAGKQYGTARLIQREAFGSADKKYDRRIDLVGFGFAGPAVAKLKKGQFVHVVGEDNSDASPSKDGSKAFLNSKISVRAVTVIGQDGAKEQVFVSDEPKAPKSEAAPAAGTNDDLPF